jgi:hypothetical protein
VTGVERTLRDGNQDYKIVLRLRARRSNFDKVDSRRRRDEHRDGPEITVVPTMGS